MMSKLSTYWNTLKYLRTVQVIFQIKNKLIKKKPVCAKASGLPAYSLNTSPIAKFQCFNDERFLFLNIPSEFNGWSDMTNGALWAYNLNYFDWIEQLPVEDACKWIDKYIEDFPSNKVGQDPYPTALRTLNWGKFFANHPECLTQERCDSLYSQYILLEKRLEYHLLGNHILEDAFALVVGAVVFKDERLWRKSSKLLKKCLEEQTLADGANYEQSPMYHCILLDRLLDVINVSQSNIRFADQKEYNDFLKSVAKKMLGHLENMRWLDGSIPMFNDSAYGIAPVPSDIFEYARRLGLEWDAIPLRECGYWYLSNRNFEVFIDAGNVTAKDQPSHTHADALSYELRIKGKPVAVDTGISTYNKTVRRQYERGSKAHNCVVVEDKDSSEVWAGFRVGRRCKVQIEKEDATSVLAAHNGYVRPCRRLFSLSEDKFAIDDYYDGEAVSYIHLAPGVDKSVVSISGADKVEVISEKASTEYNRFEDIQVLKIHFRNKLHYEYTLSDFLF